MKRKTPVYELYRVSKSGSEEGRSGVKQRVFLGMHNRVSQKTRVTF